MRKILSAKYFIWVVGLIAGIIAVLSFRAGLFKGSEYFFEDILISKKPVSEKIIIVAIDNDSIEKIGQWPWPRAVIAKILLKLNEKKPAVVGIDIVFSEESRYGEMDDLELAKTLADIDYPVVMPIEVLDLAITSLGKASASKFVITRDLFRENKNVSLAHVNLAIDQDGVVRRLPLNIEDTPGIFGSTGIPAFSKTIASKIIKEENISNRDDILRISYSQGPAGIRRIPFWQLLENNDVLKNMEDKIVLIGTTASDLHDENMTPLSKGIAMPGVEIQANVLNMLIKNYRLKEVTDNLMSVIILLAALIPILAFLLWQRSLVPLLANIVVLFVYFFAVIIFFEKGIVLNLIHILFAWTLSIIFVYLLRYFLSEQNRHELKFAFSKYVSKAVLDEILSDPSKIKLGGEERMTTVLFSDIRGFTTLAESMSPTEITEYLNRYLTLMTDVILEERGVVDKYIGDAVMAFWGAPIEDKNHALGALRASIKMQRALKDFNSENISLGKPSISIGIGLNSGKVIAGNMGSNQRFDYTVMGDSVNLASRLESLNKMYGTGILVSKNVIDGISDEEIENLNVLIREIDCVKVKGKKYGISIFEVMIDKESISKESITYHNKMLQNYYKGAWKESIQYAEKLLEIKKDDVPTIEIKKRAEEFLLRPPLDWEGIYELKNK